MTLTIDRLSLPKNHSRLASLVFLLAAAINVSAQSTVNIEGKWYGIAGFPQDRIDVGFEIKRNDKDELKVYLYQPVLNFYGLELPGVMVRDGERFVLKEYQLTLAPVDGKLEGTFFGLNAPISLQRTNKLPGEVPVPNFSKGPGPKWQTKLGEGAIFAAAALRDGVAYVGTTGGVFHAVNVKDGSFVWTFEAGRPIYGEALATAEAVFFVCDNGYLFKLDRKTGKEMWRYDLGDARVSRILPHQAVYQFDYKGPRPVAADNIVYVGSGDGSFHAVDAGNGQRVWRFEPSESAPAANPNDIAFVKPDRKIRASAIVDGTRVIFGSFDHQVYVLDRTTGKEIWKKNTRGNVSSTPALAGDKLIVANRNGLLAALNPNTGETIWRMLFWGSAVEADPVPYDSLLYIGSSDLRRVSAIDPKDGRVIWRTDVFGWAWGRVAVTDNTIYIGAAGGAPYDMRHLGSMNAIDRKTGKIIWRWPMPDWHGSYMNGFVASPAVDGQTVVIGGVDGTLYAFPTT